MMAQKAVLFNDSDALNRIMNTTSPKEQKAIGRLVKGFDPNVWDQNCKKIVFDGNYYKFSQNKNLKAELHKTIGTVLVEASPYDVIWGIGLGPDNPDRLHKDKWRGKNYLGEVLTKVRYEIFKSDIDLNICKEEYGSEKV